MSGICFVVRKTVSIVSGIHRLCVEGDLTCLWIVSSGQLGFRGVQCGIRPVRWAKSRLGSCAVSRILVIRGIGCTLGSVQWATVQRVAHQLRRHQ